jgi:hypothetical protein
MANLDDILIFVKVGEFEIISLAARSLGMPISTVSRWLSVRRLRAAHSCAWTLRLKKTGCQRHHLSRASRSMWMTAEPYFAGHFSDRRTRDPTVRSR